MNDYVILTDNCADLPQSYLDEKGISCAFLSYSMNGKHYGPENRMDDHEFYEAMRKGSMPTTAQVNPEQVKELMIPFLQKELDILYLAFSSGLSGSCASAEAAAAELREEYPERKIMVVDTLAASLGQGLLVYYACLRKEAGDSLEENARWVEDHRLNLVHLFTVDDLFHLHRGGRVSKTTAIVGSILSIKPVLHVDDEGHLIAIGKVRGRRKSVLELARLMDEKIGSYKDSCDTIFISHGDCLEDARLLEEKIREKYPLKTVLINYVNPTIGSHSGPGTLALFFLGDHR